MEERTCLARTRVPGWARWLKQRSRNMHLILLRSHWLSVFLAGWQRLSISA
jgi:hypothetical protein